MDIERLGNKIIGLAIEVHRQLGPGLLESTYEHCLAYELDKAGIFYKKQEPVDVIYKGKLIPQGYRIDLLIENSIIIELKSVNEMKQIYIAQILTYLKLRNISLGYLINFNTTALKYGIHRLVNNL